MVKYIAPVVQWIEHRTSKPVMLVRFQPGAQTETVRVFAVGDTGLEPVTFPV